MRSSLWLVGALAAAFIALATPLLAEDVVPCEQVESIGVATMDADEVISMRIRSLPPGPIAEHTFTYKPDSKNYADILKHLGGLVPGQIKPVKPWC